MASKKEVEDIVNNKLHQRVTTDESKVVHSNNYYQLFTSEFAWYEHANIG